MLNHIPDRARSMIFDEKALAGHKVISLEDNVARPSYKEKSKMFGVR